MTKLTRIMGRVTGMAAFAAVGVIAMAGAASAQAKWDLADEYGADALTGKASKNYIEMLHEKVGDQLVITYQGGGALGYKSKDHFDAVQDGAVQSAVTLVTQLGGIEPIFNLSSLPFIAQTPRDAYLLWEAARPEYERIFAENGMVLLWAMPNPPSGINAKMPITSIEALEGLRIRTYDVNGTETLINAGASPLQIAWSDLIPQLSTGGIDAVLTSADGARQLSLWDYVSDFTEANYAMGLFMMHVNKDAFDALPAETQQAMLDLVPAADEYNWKIMEESIDEAYTFMTDNGMNVTSAEDIPQAVFDHLQAAGAKVRDGWVEATGDAGKAILARYAELRAAK